MRTFNIWGNTEQYEFETFFKDVIDFLELGGTGAYNCRHIDGTEELGGAYTYMSHFISVEEIIRKTSAHLDSKG